MNIWWTPAYQPVPTPSQPYTTGWACPRCGRVWAPYVSSCTCGSGTYYNTYGTGTDSNDSGLITNFNITLSNPDTFTFPDPHDPDEYEDDDDGPQGCPV